VFYNKAVPRYPPEVPRLKVPIRTAPSASFNLVVSPSGRVVISPSSQSAQAGAALSYSVSILDNDSAICSASSFNLQAVVPAGWAAAFPASTVTLSPGSSTSTTLSVSSPATAASTSYTVGATAARTTNAATATATYSVLSLASTVSTDKSSYSPGDTVVITDTVTVGTPLANASVTFIVTKPNGVTGTQTTATTNANGEAVYKLRPSKQKGSAGTYQVRAAASSKGASTSATTTFTVR